MTRWTVLPFGTADHGHHVLQLHENRINRFIRSLADRKNPVAGLEPFVRSAGPPGDDFFNRGIAVIRPEDSSNSF